MFRYIGCFYLCFSLCRFIDLIYFYYIVYDLVAIDYFLIDLYVFVFLYVYFGFYMLDCYYQTPISQQ